MGEEIDKLKEAAERIKNALLGLRVLKGWAGVLGFFQAAPHVVAEVEAAAIQYGFNNQDKKTLATNILLEIIPDRWCPDWILQPILSWAIERAVAALKAKIQPK